MECSCEVDVCFDDYIEEINQENKNAEKEEKCTECGKIIKIGEEYEFFKGNFDDHTLEYSTCMDCLSIRYIFFKDWTFACIWGDLEQYIRDEDGEIPEHCISRLTKRAMGKVCEIIEDTWKGLEEYDN